MQSYNIIFEKYKIISILGPRMMVKKSNEDHRNKENESRSVDGPIENADTIRMQMKEYCKL